MSHLIEREPDETPRKTKNRRIKEEKELRAKNILNDAIEYRRMKGRGEISVVEGDEGRDILLPVKPNICNHCGKGFNSVKAKIEHVEDNNGPHGDHFIYWCTKKGCGCVYEKANHLDMHKLIDHQNLQQAAMIPDQDDNDDDEEEMEE